MIRTQGEHGFLTDLIFCPWCVSVWISFTVTIPALWLGTIGFGLSIWTKIVLSALLIPTASQVAGMAARAGD